MQVWTYDRSVIIDDDEWLTCCGDSYMCNCHNCITKRSHAPALVISRGSDQRGTPRGTSEQAANDLYDVDAALNEQNITFRNVREFVDGGILELVGGDKDKHRRSDSRLDQPLSLLIYSQRHGHSGHRQVGVCAALPVEDCLKGIIKRHENVTKDAPNIPSITNTNSRSQGNPLSLANPSHKYGSSSVSVHGKHTSYGSTPTKRNMDPVMMMYRRNDRVQEVIDRIITNNKPALVLSKPSQSHARRGIRKRCASDGDQLSTDDLLSRDFEDLTSGFVRIENELLCNSRSNANACNNLFDIKGFAEDVHEVWAVSDPADITALMEAFSGVDSLYIADGHHRTAAACHMLLNSNHDSMNGNMSQSQNSSTRPCHQHQHAHIAHTKYLMGILFPDTHMSVLPYNRCVTTLGGKSSKEFLTMVAERFYVREISTQRSPRSGSSGDRARIAGTESEEMMLVSPEEGKDSVICSLSTHSTGSASIAVLSSVGVSFNISDSDIKRSRLRSISVEGLDNGGGGDNGNGRSAYSSSINSHSVDPSPTENHHISMFFGGRWYDLFPLDALEEKVDDPVSSLDVQVLFGRLLRPVLDIGCPRTDSRMIYVCGDEGYKGVEQRVCSGQAVVGFCVTRVSIVDIMRVADAGQLMPPKATFFDPKPLSGVLVRLH